MRAPVESRLPTRGLGAWLARRSDGARLHAGVDMAMGPATVCVAPENGVVVEVAEASRPRPGERQWSRPAGWAGYGPMLALVRGDSGVWHLLAHLDSIDVEAGQRVTEGQRIGRGSIIHHVHWEVRTQARPGPGQATVEITLDPGAWLRGERVPWAGQCPERPANDRRTPAACRPGARPRTPAARSLSAAASTTGTKGTDDDGQQR